jgi:serine/threonine-protein kinase
MEFLEGEELSRLVSREGPQPPARMIRIAAQAALALQQAHSFGVIHRDLKPDNVFLCRSLDGDVVKVLDFGSVKLQMETGPKLTAFGTTLGSPYYMSPEQAMGKLDVDHRTDVFALAAILYEIATAKVAFEGSQVAEILMKIINHNPAPPTSINASYPAGFDDVIDRGIKKKKEERFSSVTELADAAIASVGLTGNTATWAATPIAQIEAAVGQASPPAPKPFGAPAGGFGAPAGAFGAPQASSVPPSGQSASAGPIIALAGLAVALVLGTGIAVWALFG